MEAGQENFDLFEQVQMNAVVMVRDSGTGLLRPIEYDTEKGGIPLAVKFESAASFRSAVLPSYTSNALKFLRVNAGETDVEWGAAFGGGTPGGSDKQMQYNDGGVFAGADLEWDKTAKTLVAKSTANQENGYLSADKLGAWTVPGDWTGSNPFTHSTPAGAGVLQNAFVLTSGKLYRIIVTIAGRTSGEIKVTAGGTEFSGITSTSSFVVRAA